MAILDQFPGAEVSILVNGIRSTEYDDPDEALDAHGPFQPTANKYIEAKDGAEFSIDVELTTRLKLPLNCNGVAINFLIDGVSVTSWVVTVDEIRNRRDGKWKCAVDATLEPGYTPNTVLRHKFKFSPVSTVEVYDHQRLEKDRLTAQALGLITVSFVAVLSNPMGIRRKTAASWGPGANNSFNLAEKALKGKAISHGTDLSEGKMETGHVNIVPCSYPSGLSPIAVFKFLYRSKRALQTQLIIPRDPTPPVEPRRGAALGSVDELSPSELRRLAKERLDQMAKERLDQTAKERLDRIKKEKSAVETKVRVKREREDTRNLGPAMKIARTNSGEEWIDLTEL